MGKTLADLQSNISISAQNAVTGDIEWCSGYTQFSTDIGEQAGWYLALQVTPDVEDATVTAAYNGTIRELDNNIFIIRLAEGEDSITFTANKEGYTEGRLTLNLSGLNKETITNYCYVTSLTNGVTVTPLQFGESKTLSGVVPYDTTTSSNHFRLKYRTFIPIPAGSQISVSHFGTELGSSTFSTVTPQEGDPYSEATVDITITQDILDSQSPGLSTLIIPDTGEVLDRFYCSLDVENLTLEAAPAPFEFVAYNAEGVQFTKAQLYSSEGTISGPTGGGGTDYIFDTASFKFNFNSNYPNDDNQYYIAIKANLPAKITLNDIEYNFDVLQDYESTNNTITAGKDQVNNTIYLKFRNISSSNISIARFQLKDTVKNQSKTFYIYVNNSTFEADSRQNNPGNIEYLQEGSYNSLPITDYFTKDNAFNIVSKNVNGNNYLFIKVSNPENAPIETPATFTDVTTDITGTTLLSTDKVYRGDFKELTTSYTYIYLGGTALYKFKQFHLSNFGANFSNIPLYANGLNSRNIGIEPLSSSDKAIGTNQTGRTLGSYTDISFTTVDPSTATPTTVDNVKNIDINLTGTLNKFTKKANSVINVNYDHCYKPWPMSYSGPDNRKSFDLDRDYYFLIIKLTNNWKFNQLKIKYYFSDGTNFVSNPFDFQTTPNGEALIALPCTDTKYPIALETTIDDSSVPVVKYNFDWTNITFAT